MIRHEMQGRIYILSHQITAAYDHLEILDYYGAKRILILGAKVFNDLLELLDLLEDAKTRERQRRQSHRDGGRA